MVTFSRSWGLCSDLTSISDIDLWLLETTEMFRSRWGGGGKREAPFKAEKKYKKYWFLSTLKFIFTELAQNLAQLMSQEAHTGCHAVTQ